MSKYTDKQAQDELKRLIDEIDNVRKKPRLSPKFKSWQVEASGLLEKLFGRSSKQVKEFDRIPYSLAAFSNQTPDSKFDEAFHQGLKTAAIALSSAVKEIQTNGLGGKSKQITSAPAPNNPPVDNRSENKASVSAAEVTALATAFAKSKQTEEKPKVVSTAPVSANSKKILVLMSGDKNVSNEVHDFLSKLGLNPVTANHSVSKHAAVFSEIDKHLDAAYAVVLLGFDEKVVSSDTAYGLGMLVGRMGRDKVCAVINDKSTGIDTYDGITYVPVDPAGAWKFVMIKNLKTAGFDVDANLAL